MHLDPGLGQLDRLARHLTGNVEATETPAGAGGHVDAKPEAPGFLHRERQHLLPLRARDAGRG